MVLSLRLDVAHLSTALLYVSLCFCCREPPTSLTALCRNLSFSPLTICRAVPLGALVAVTVIKTSAEGIPQPPTSHLTPLGLAVQLNESKVPARIPVGHLSDHPGLCPTLLRCVSRCDEVLTRRLYPVGTVIENVVVLAREGKRSPTLLLSLKASQRVRSLPSTA